LNYRNLMTLQQNVMNDSKDLFFDMNIYNKYTEKMRKALIKSLIDIDLVIKNECKRRNK
jgi:hypothetical protein